MSTEKEKMLAGEFYHSWDAELQADQAAARDWMERYNFSSGLSSDAYAKLLRERFGQVGEQSSVRPPFHCDYGYNIKLGASVFLNFNCIILDVVEVEIGDKTMIGPGVQILTADHPRDPVLRAKGREFGRPVRIGKNVWIGAGALILPGVTVGDNAVIGAGSVVPRDVPAGVTVMGNPARAA
jgi:maltose O-acetyltransferase